MVSMMRTGGKISYGGSRTVDMMVLIMTAVFFSNIMFAETPVAEEAIYAYPVVMMDVPAN